MKEKDDLIIYWAPRAAGDIEDQNVWNMLYDNPVSLFEDMVKIKNHESKSTAFTSCPAFTGRFKNVFVFKNNLQSSFSYTTLEDGTVDIRALNTPHVGLSVEHDATTTQGPLLSYNMSFNFFCEESVTPLFNPPYFHKPGYTKYGSIIPGSFDIGQWYRPFNVEIQMWEPSGELHLEVGEPLFYLEVPTERRVILKRYEFTKKAHAYALSCSSSPQQFGAREPLANKYRRFMSTSTNKLVLKEIKNNLLED